jgi:hypothetical protein
VIHAFLAGFAGCIGVLVACVCWNRCNEWLADRAERRLTKEAPADGKSAHQREWEDYASRR